MHCSGILSQLLVYTPLYICLSPFKYHSSFQVSLYEEQLLQYCKLSVRALYILYNNFILYYYRMIPDAQYLAGGQENDEVQ